ncbi:MAG TPA: hypothetical protein VFU23_14135 [Gemmatimonadales bacterium]|nr:hypothetical protein [Gemmatimonadales bacterium]
MNDPARRFLPLLATAGAIILVHQGLDLFSLARGADLSTAPGRLGLLAAVSSRGPAFLAADVCFMVAAVISGRALPGLATAHLVLGVTALGMSPVFIRDAGVMAGNITLDELTSFRITVVRILAGLCIIGVGATVAAFALFRAGREDPKAA